MATLTSYEYDKQVNSDKITVEIQKDSAISVALDHIGTDDGVTTIWFRDALPTEQKTELDAIVAAHDPTPLPDTTPKNISNTPIFEQSLRLGTANSTSFTLVTPDFTDRTSWYQASVQVTGGALTDTGDGLSFQAASGVRNWVDMLGPKLTLDYKKVLERDGSLTSASLRYVTVYSNGVAVPSTGYTIDSPNGKITFNTSQSGNTITADYWHNDGLANASEFLFNPPPGYKFIIEHVELQFSQNMSFTDSIVFEVWAGASLGDYSDFNIDLFDAGYGQSRTTYRNMGDLINWCNNEYPPIPACGTFTQQILVFPFKFLVSPVIDSAQGALVRLATTTNGALTGEIATATLYMELVQNI